MAQFLFGIPFLLLGGYFMLAGFGALPLYARALVPLWVIACAGLVFFIPGVTLCFTALVSRAGADSNQSGARVIRAEEGRAGVLGAWGAALFVPALVAVFWGAILSDAPGSGNMPEWMFMGIIGLFTLLAVGLVGSAIHLTLGALRFGEARLVLAPGVAQVGGSLKGYVELPAGNLPAQVAARLQCLRYEVKLDADAPRGGSEVQGMLKGYWEESVTAPVKVVAGRSRIDINIPIPEGLPASHLPENTSGTWVIPGSVYCLWKFKISADVPGVDLSRTFTVDVQPGESPADSAGPVPDLAEESDLDRKAAAAKVAVAELTAGRTPAAVAGRLEALGLSDALISRVFNEISADQTWPFAPTVRAYTANLARIQAEVDSGQLLLLSHARGSVQSNQGAVSRLPVLSAADSRAPVSGMPVLLADESVLCRHKWFVGGFLMVWGAMFAGIPAAIGIADATQRNPGLFFMFVLGSAAFCGGLWLMARRHCIWLLPEQGQIEEKTGVFRADQTRYHDLSDFDRVITAKSVSRNSKGRISVTYHVALTQSAAREEGALGLGDFSEFEVAHAAAMRVAARMSLPVYDLTTDSDPKPIFLAATAGGNIAAVTLEPDWWRRPSALVLILANLVPIGGVLFAQWEVFPIMLLFWLENLIVGLITVLKMLACGRGRFVEKSFMVPFFLIHYGMFCSVHGVFVFSLFAPKGESLWGAGGLLPDPAGILQVVLQQGVWFAVVALFASHGFSFAANFLGRGEYRTAEVGKVMMAPYGRIVVLHVVIIFGGFVVMALDAPLIALLLLVILKIIMDLYAHLREHRRNASAALVTGVPGTAASP